MATEVTKWILDLVDGVTGPMKKISAETNKLKGDFDSIGTKGGLSLSAIGSELPMIGGGLSMLANPATLAAAGIAAVGAGLVKATMMANTWKEGMAEINVTAQQSQGELKKLSDELLTIGMNNSAPLEQVPNTMNRIISAGLDAKEALNALEPTLQAAKAGFVDAGLAAEAGVAVMNSAGVEDITEVYDVLFATVIKGTATFSDIANYLPKIVPAAKNAGFALGETAGAWAFLTAQGQTAEQATTLMDNAMKALTSPDRIKAFNQMGISIFDANGKMRGLADIVEDLAGKTKGLTDEQKTNFLAQLGLDSEAAKFFAVATQKTEEFRETIEFTTDSQGQLNEAVKNAETPMDAWNELMNNVKGNAIKLGDLILPLFTEFGKKILSVVDWFKDLYANSLMFRDLMSGIGTVIGVVWDILMINVNAAINVFKGAYGLVKSFFGLFGFSGIGEWYHGIRPYIVWIHQMFSSIYEIVYKIFTLDLKGVVSSMKSFTLPSLETIIEQQVIDDENKKTEANSIKEDSTAKIPKDDKVKNAGDADKLAALLDKDKGAGIQASGSSSFKNINQSIDMKNNFYVSKGDSTELESIAEKIVRAINNKLRDDIVAVQ